MNINAVIDSLLDVGFTCSVCYPYIIVHNKPLTWPDWTPEEIAEALNIDPSLCSVNMNGDVRIATHLSD